MHSRVTSKYVKWCHLIWPTLRALQVFVIHSFIQYNSWSARYYDVWSEQIYASSKKEIDRPTTRISVLPMGSNTVL